MYGTGFEKSVVNNMPDGFVIRAKHPGKIAEYDATNKLVVLEYDDGTKDVIDLDNVIQHNSAGGFYENIHYTMLKKEGQRFKQDEVLAKTDAFFKGSKANDLTYSMGRLVKVGLTSVENTLSKNSSG